MDEYYVITDDSALVRKEDNTKEVEETDLPESRLWDMYSIIKHIDLYIYIYIYIYTLGDSQRHRFHNKI